MGVGVAVQTSVASAHQQPPSLLHQRSLNCNNTYSEGPDMLRTALGESTASLDSTTRLGLRTHYFLGGKRCPALNPDAQSAPCTGGGCFVSYCC